MATTPSEIGAQAELAIAVALARAGKNVYLPLFAAHSRVDLVMEDDEGLRRVQCKTARIAGGTVMFRTCSNTRNVPRDYRGEVDVFAVYSPELDKVYLVPVDDVPVRLGFLRLGPARNGQQRGIRWAADYELRAPPAADLMPELSQVTELAVGEAPEPGVA